MQDKTHLLECGMDHVCSTRYMYCQGFLLEKWIFMRGKAKAASGPVGRGPDPIAHLCPHDFCMELSHNTTHASLVLLFLGEAGV